VRVLGVDPGLGVTGYAVVQLRDAEARIIEAGAIRPPPRETFGRRLQAIHADISEIIREFLPDAMGLESLYSEYRFPRTALQMAHARGVICLAATDAQIPVVDIAPSEVKSALIGVGSATKDQVARTVQSLFRLEKLPSPPDVTDAIAVATAVAYRSTRA
jgi:crossover junction endodeoxyribonuclease RuvC